jgi:hypothetical protein
LGVNTGALADIGVKTLALGLSLDINLEGVVVDAAVGVVDVAAAVVAAVVTVVAAGAVVVGPGTVVDAAGVVAAALTDVTGLAGFGMLEEFCASCAIVLAIVSCVGTLLAEPVSEGEDIMVRGEPGREERLDNSLEKLLSCSVTTSLDFFCCTLSRLAFSPRENSRKSRTTSSGILGEYGSRLNALIAFGLPTKGERRGERGGPSVGRGSLVVETGTVFLYFSFTI